MPCCQLKFTHALHRGPGKNGQHFVLLNGYNKCHCNDSICAVEDSTPGLPFRVAGTKGERLPMLEPEHLARRRRRVPAPTLGTVSPTALTHFSHLAKHSSSHSHFDQQRFRQGPSTSVLAQGHAGEAGAPPTRPLLKGPCVSQMGSRAPC